MRCGLSRFAHLRTCSSLDLSDHLGRHLGVRSGPARFEEAGGRGFSRVGRRRRPHGCCWQRPACLPGRGLLPVLPTSGLSFGPTSDAECASSPSSPFGLRAKNVVLSQGASALRQRAPRSRRGRHRGRRRRSRRVCRSRLFLGPRGRRRLPLEPMLITKRTTMLEV